MKETAERCQDGSPVMPAGQGWLTEVKGTQRGVGSIGYRRYAEGKKFGVYHCYSRRLDHHSKIAVCFQHNARLFTKNMKILVFHCPPQWLHTHTHTANNCILLTTNCRMMSSWFCWIRSKRVSTSAILLSTHTTREP